MGKADHKAVALIRDLRPQPVSLVRHNGQGEHQAQNTADTHGNRSVGNSTEQLVVFAVIPLR